MTTREEKNLHKVKEAAFILTDDDKQYVRAFSEVKDAFCEFRPARGEKPVVCRVMFYTVED